MGRLTVTDTFCSKCNNLSELCGCATIIPLPERQVQRPRGPARPDLKGALAAPEIRAVIETLAGVRAERVRWLWDLRLPIGKVVCLDGDPGSGKSTITVDWAARVTTGAAWPDGAPGCEPGDVLLLSAEDGLADTIKPRLAAAGADMDRVHALTAVRVMGEDGSFTEVPPSLPADLERIEEIVLAKRVKLVVIDVLMAYLSGKVDAHRDQDVRSVMHRLKDLADRTGAVIVLVRHLRKARDGNAINAGGGSIGIIGAARVGLVAARDPEDETGERRVLAVAKVNIARCAPSLSYRMVEDPVHGAARISWDTTPCTVTADQLLSRADDDDSAGDRNSKVEWLVNFLASRGGEAPFQDLLKAARAADISESALRRIKGRAGVEIDRSGFQGGSVWRLLTEVANDAS